MSHHPTRTDATSGTRPDRTSLRIVWSYARPHLGTLAAGVLFGLLATAAALATPLATKRVLDGLGGDAGLLVPVGLLLGLLATGLVAGFAQTMILGTLAERIVLGARVSLIERFFRAKLEPVQRLTGGELVTRVTSDTVLLREATTSSVAQLTNGVVALAGTVVLMAVLDLPLLASTLLALLVVGVLLAVLLPQIGRADKRAQDAIGELGGMVAAGMRAIRTVKACRAESRTVARLSDKANESTRHAIRSVRIAAIASPVATGGIQLAVIAILGLGAWRVSLGELSVSTLVAFLLYAFYLVEPVSSLTVAFTQLQSGLAAAARIRETEHLQPERLRPEPPATPGPLGAGADPAGPVLALRDVTAGYLDAPEPAVRRLSLEIPRHGHTAIVGPTGAGKTTVFSLVLRFVDPESGHLELDGLPYDRLGLDQVRSRIAYVEQDAPVISGTVRENVLFRVPDASDEEAWSALGTAHLAERVRLLPGGLDAPVSDTDLSGGERQRLALARAFVRTPDVLLLDEATAQLDGVTEAAVQEAVAGAARTGAVVTIAHRLSTVLDADRIVVLDAGRVRDQGTHDELLGRDLLYRDFVSALRIAA